LMDGLVLLRHTTWGNIRCIPVLGHISALYGVTMERIFLNRLEA
jgi:hypothetical protein